MLTKLFWLWRNGVPAPTVVAHGARLHWRLFRHPRTPFSAKALFVLAAAYAISPLDLVPDWILLLGQLDDLGVFLWGMWLFRKLVPEDVLAEVEAGLGSPKGLPEPRPRAR